MGPDDLTLFHDLTDQPPAPPAPPSPAEDTWEPPLPDPPPDDDDEVEDRWQPPADQLPAPAPAPGAAAVDPAAVAEMLATLNAEQLQAATSRAPAVVITAGPGSGKTRTITARIAKLIADGADPRRILAVTFTNKAAGEMAERLEQLLGVTPGWRGPGPAVATFHATCAWMARLAVGQLDHLQAGFTILDAADSTKVLTDVLYPDGMPADRKAANAEVKTVAALISQARNNNDLDDLRPEVAHILHAYRIRLQSLNAIDYDGLLETGVDVLTDPATGWAARYDHVLVDEFQDTNVAQQDMVEMWRRAGASVTVCGDFDQSIYAWRGARPDHLADLAARWPGVQVLQLGTNYRSTPQIVTAAAAVIEPNAATWRVNLTAANDPGAAVQVDTPYNVWEEGEMVAGRIAADGDPSRHAVLVRARTQTLFVEKALVAARIPYTTLGTTAFTDRAEVKDALAWLRVAVNPADLVALTRAASAPRRGVGPAAMDAIIDAARDAGTDPARWLADGGQPAGRGAKAAAAFGQALADLYAAAQRGPAALMTAVLHDIGLAAHHAGADELAEVRADNLAALAEDAQAHTDQHGATLEQSVDWVTSLALASSADADDDAVVTISTAHAAKGREFDVVHVVGVDGRHYPHINVAEDPDAVAEERRLLFVAMTRARHLLHLTWPLVSKPAFAGPGTPDSPTAVSPFIAPLMDLPAGVADTSRVRRAAPAPARPRTTAGSWPAGRSRNVMGRVAAAGNTSHRHRTPRPPVAPRPTPVAGHGLVGVEVSPGDRVVHVTFGGGTILQATADRLTVTFDDAGRKVLTRTAPVRLAS